jgi:hypothetical protein
MERRDSFWFSTIFIGVTVGVVRLFGQPASPKSAVPTDAISGIVNAFTNHDVVALGEGPHGNEQGHAFRLSLIRDPRFAAVVNDILVESGSGRYQDVMDQYTAGESVPTETLRHVWEDTTAAGPVWDAPIYADFFRAVRELNGSLAPDHRIRVLLGDAPIDWSRVKTAEDLRAWGLKKDAYAGGLVRTAVAKHHRVLVIYGDGHLLRGQLSYKSLMSVMEQSPNGASVFAIGSSFQALRRAQEDVTSWPAPSVTVVRGTVVGERPYASFYPPPPEPGWSIVRLQDQFDAMLYLGPESVTISRISPALCRDAAYMKMRLERMALDFPPAVKGNTDGLKAHCTAQTSQ